MATTITAGNGTNGGAAISPDNTGILELKTGTGSGTTAVTVDASQNVGIGTTSPAYKLDVTSSAFTIGRFTRSGAGASAAIDLVEGSGGYVRLACDGGTNNFSIRPAGTVTATFDSSGNLGLGVTPSAWGSVALELPNGVGLGNFTGTLNLTQNAFSSAAGGSWKYKSTAAATLYQQQTGAHYWFTAASGTAGNAITFTERFQVNDAGILSTTVYAATVGATNRDLFIDNTGKFGYVSSLRASKTNIQNLTDTSWLHQLNPVTFNYRKKDEEGNYTDETDGDIQYGMIAEDVEQVRPDLCFYDEVDGEQELRGIQYSKLVPVMLKEIQKLRAELDALKGESN